MTDDEIVELIETCEEWADRPFTTAPQLSDRVGMSRQGMHQRLQQLVGECRVEKYKVGQSAIYYPVDDTPDGD